jgi:hypothetical protein
VGYFKVLSCHSSGVTAKIHETFSSVPSPYCFTILVAYLHLWLYSPCGHWPLFQFLNLYAVGRTPWTGDQPVARPLPTHRTAQTQNKRTQPSMPRLGFEPTIPAFEWAKTVHTSDRTATVIGFGNTCNI